ncbi:hypothetical protein [Aeromonas phage ZPAH34]|uniref:hypothetical protein n=1 Tax=Aeromonas phage ZPAH34 TaxID=2924888 RepID=UPI0023293BF0|nr:hypothetical protein PQD16_gp044 [Aeromonas phage ZPAH34]UOX39639.1 hypothetical protein [Aeromonas phage ZPAH34]
MRYDITMSGKRRIDSIIVSHNNEKIEFRGVATVNGGDATQELFEFLNEFFEGSDPNNIDKIFNLFKQGKRILEPGYFEEEETEELIQLRAKSLDYEFLTEKLQAIIKEMYAIISPNDIAYAADVTGRCVAPKDLMQMASMGDYPEETTIDNIKYAELVKLAFTAQLSYPLVHQLLDQINEVTGKDYQYAVAGNMIPNIGYIPDMAGWKIMDTYIRASAARQEGKRNTATVVSDAKYIDHIVSKGLFNKLCLSFIPSKVKDKNLSKELNSLVAGEERKDQSFKFSTFSETRKGSEDQSIPESYRIAQAVNGTDELALCEYFSFGMFDENDNPIYHDFFKHQAIGLGIKNQALAEKLYNNLPAVWNFRFTNIQYQLLQLTFAEDVNYYLYPAMDYRQLLAAICLAQVKLFEMGYEHLATVICAVRNKNGAMTFINDEFKLNTKEREELCNLSYIYSGQNTATTDNFMVIGTQNFLDELASSSWESNIEPGLLGNQVFIDAIGQGDMYPIDLVPEIKQELVAFIKQVNEIVEE